MTVSASRTAELSINDIVKAAYVQAGMLPFQARLDNTRGAWGRNILETIVKELEAQGVQVRARSFVTVPLTVSQDRYTLADTVLDVLGDGQYMSSAETDVEHASVETPVMMVDQARWHQIPTKAAQGIPTMFWADRSGAAVGVRIWPQPSDAGTIRFPVQLLYPDSTDGNATMALERPWQQYFIYELGWQLAEGGNMTRDKISALRSVAMQKLALCRGFSSQRTESQIVLDHDTGWSYR